VAACNIGGVTLHRWTGIGLGDESMKVMLGRAFGKKEQWQKARVLIIDEISMVRGRFLALPCFPNRKPARRPTSTACVCVCVPVHLRVCVMCRVCLWYRVLLLGLADDPSHVEWSYAMWKAYAFWTLKS